MGAKLKLAKSERKGRSDATMWQATGTPETPLGVVAGRLRAVAATQARIEAQAAAMAVVLGEDAPAMKAAREVLQKFAFNVSSPSSADVARYLAAFEALPAEQRQTIAAARESLYREGDGGGFDQETADAHAKAFRVLRLNDLIARASDKDSPLAAIFRLAAMAIDGEYPNAAAAKPLVEHALAMWEKLPDAERVRILNGWNDCIGHVSIQDVVDALDRIECRNVLQAYIGTAERPYVAIRRAAVPAADDAAHSAVEVLIDEGTSPAEAIDALRAIADTLAATIHEAIAMDRGAHLHAPIFNIRNEACVRQFTPGEGTKIKPLSVFSSPKLGGNGEKNAETAAV